MHPSAEFKIRRAPAPGCPPDAGGLLRAPQGVFEFHIHEISLPGDPLELLVMRNHISLVRHNHDAIRIIQVFNEHLDRKLFVKGRFILLLLSMRFR